MARKRDPNINSKYFKEIDSFIRPTDKEINAVLNVVSDMNDAEKERDEHKKVLDKQRQNIINMSSIINNKKSKLYEIVETLKKINNTRSKK